MVNEKINTNNNSLGGIYFMTTLYVKRHLITGLKYFGVTKREGKYFDSYKGSGKYWKRHIRKHGYNVETIIIDIFDDDDPLLVETALKFSRDNNIVESNEWANLKEENGLDGGSVSDVYTEESRKKMSIAKKGKPLTEEHKRKIGEAGLGRTYTEERNRKISENKKGIPRSEETKRKVSETRTGMKVGKQEVVICPYCNKSGGKTGMKLFHFDNCLFNPDVDLSKRKKIKILTCPHCGLEGAAFNMYRWHFDNCKQAEV